VKTKNINPYNNKETTMKTISTFAIILLTIMTNLALANNQGTPLTILFTNDVHGKMEPCG